MSETRDLQHLLARLQSGLHPQEEPESSTATTTTSTATAISHLQPPASVSSPWFNGAKPHLESATMTSLPDANPHVRAANLLSLLRFNQPSSPVASPQPMPTPTQDVLAGAETSSGASRDRTVLASDLIANFTRNKLPPSSMRSPTLASPGATKPGEVSASAGGSSQSYLLNLLNQAKPSASSRPDSVRSLRPDEPIPSTESVVPEAAVDGLAEDLASASFDKTSASRDTRERSPVRVFGSEEPGQANDFHAPQVAAKPGIFTYTNPFELLSASSPRNRTPFLTQATRGDAAKIDIFNANKENTPDMGQKQTREAVDQAVEEVVARVDKQEEPALAVAEAQHAKAEPAPVPVVDDVERAAETKSDLKDDQTHAAVEEASGKPAPEAREEAAQDGVKDTYGDSWESADAEEAANGEKRAVRVFNFPMKPFVSLDIGNLETKVPTFQHDAYLTIARLRKEFDQNDRSLVAATENFIAYVTPKTEGIRVLEQENGAFKNMFGYSRERIVSVSLCSTAKSAPSPMETVLATGVSGSVFWAHLTGEKESFCDNLDQRTVVFPPFPLSDDNTSGGQLKTRARRSSRNPRFFAIGRGKHIYIIWPEIACLPHYTDQVVRVCSSERYLEERRIRISTGKAGKDFAFSQCDTVIVSLDKTGKMKFWDIRALINTSPPASPAEFEPIEVKKPILSLITTSPSEKSWPTSVMFVDKDRPYNKGIALRYLIVGMKQNHTLQLWDLVLQKAVQEINLPHENESDGICSVTYHPQTSIITVGHPTRNSIYFIHLSAPRYLLPPMSQAKFMARVAEGDKTLPKVESTAIMTAIRELSFAPFGQLRSLESLSVPPPASNTNEYDEERTLFELYVMHSKGVARVSVRTDHMGWNSKDEVIDAVDAENTGAIVVNELKTATSVAPSEASVSGDPPPKSIASKSSKVTTTKDQSPSKKESSVAKQKPYSSANSVVASTLARVESKEDAARAALINGTDKDQSAAEKNEKKKKKKKLVDAVVAQVSAPAALQSRPLVPSYAKAVSQAREPSASPPKRAVPSAAETIPVRTATPSTREVTSAADSASLKSLEDNVTTALSQLFNKELESLYRKFDNDKRIQDAAGSAKLDAVLRLVSSTLTDNVEKSLSRIVSSSLASTLLPSLAEQVSAIVEGQLKHIGDEVRLAVGTHHKAAVAAATSTAMQDAVLQQSLGEAVAKRVAAHVDAHLTSSLNKSITPAFTKLTFNAVQQIAADIDQRMATSLRQANTQRQNDSVKIEQLTSLVRSLTDTVNNMAQGQSELRKDMQLLQRHVAATATTGVQHSGPPHSSHSSIELSPATPLPPQKTPEEMEMDEIRELLGASMFEEAMSKWVQSERKTELFSDILHRCNPVYLRNLSSLVGLSVAAALTQPFQPNMQERLTWLEVVLSGFNPLMEDVYEITPRIMDIIAGRLQTVYMELANCQGQPGAVMKRIYALHARASELRDARDANEAATTGR